MFTFNFENFTVSYRAVKNPKVASFGNMKNYNHYKIIVANNTTKEKVMFDFWNSIAHPEFENVDDVENALDCIVSDANCGENSFAVFCDELGYNSDSIKDKQIYKACVRTKEKLDLIGFTKEKREQFTDYIREKENN